ncbi:hypothetical protein QC763_0097900 [Podospora pseudopauciseta]|uniref:Uncharacterized protein n=1 Tax=Podospora pseudopauciseta TaxID=2093780 RepID=A0ABR0H642_9PEZI|nr:hypothetical protein QC763_0097900 [Podospora pseudopauciseta]
MNPYQQQQHQPIPYSNFGTTGGHVASYNTGRHAQANPGTQSFSGYGNGVAYAQPIPHASQAALTSHFADSARTQVNYARTHNGRPGSSAEREQYQNIPSNIQMPGAAATYVAPGTVYGGPGNSDPRRGNVMYASTSLKGNPPGPTRNNHARVAPALNGAVPANHDKKKKCAEPAVFSNYAYDHRGTQAQNMGGSVYPITTNGNTYLPPCGHANPNVKPGCRHCVAAIGATSRS